MIQRRHARPSSRRRGLTLIEAVVAMLIVSGLLAASMQAVALSSVIQFKAAQRTTASWLGSSMLADILTQSYEDPLVTPLFGRETGEVSTSKANYDDVDDFNGWVETPPQDRDGTVLAKMTNWERSVTVQWVNPLNVTQVSVTETGAKRITVTVKFKGVTLLTCVALRTKVS